MLGPHEVPPSPTGEGQHAPRAAVGQVPWGVWDALGVFFLALVLTMLIGGLLAAALPTTVPETVATAIFGPLTLVILGLTALVWVRVRYPGHARQLAGRRPRAADAAIGVGVGIATVIVVTVVIGLLLGLILQLLGQDLPVVQQDLRQMARDPATVPILVGSAVIAAPVFEELFFRGMVFPALAKRLGVWPGIVGSALVFGLVHVNQAEDALGAALLLVRLVPLGILFAWLYRWRGTIVVPIIVHSIFNGASVLLFLAGLE